MATALVVERILEQALQNTNLSELQRQQLRLHVASASRSSSLDAAAQRHVPRSMSYSTSSMMPTPHPDVNAAMGRTHSAPTYAPMGRSISASSNNNGHMAAWPSPTDNNSGYTLVSQPASLRKRPSLQPIHESTMYNNNAMVEYDPADYVNNFLEPSGSAPLPIAHRFDPSRLQINQLTQDSQWNLSIDSSISPSTPEAALMTPTTISSSGMSPQASLNPQFFDEVSMLRVHSDSSSLFPPLLNDVEDGFPISYPVVTKDISSVDTSVFPTSFTGSCSSEIFPSHTPLSRSVSALGDSSSQQQPDLAEDMRRSASSSSESDSSYASASSTSTRQLRREREIAAQASRKIAPAPVPADCSDETQCDSSNIQMKRVLSSDGTSKGVAPISKAPYIRPQHPKIMCQFCNLRPEGFRGTHELDRHVARAHAKIRKGYICIDASEDQKFLANCKHCRNKKVYGAYYNAAAHLRRAHFHPRKRGRKGKGVEKRGGIGGGDDPPMDLLKQRWIKEIEVAAIRVKQAAPEQYSSSFSDNSPLDASDNTDSFDFECMDTSYPLSNNDMPTAVLDFNHDLDSGAFMQQNDATFDFNNFNPNIIPNNISNFEFDACINH